MWKKPEKTKEPENAEKAYDYAVFLLSLKLRTVGEVVRKMQQRGYHERVIGETIEHLKAQRYLNDRQYAEIFLENLKAYRTFGYYGIKKKFMEKKLPQELIESVLDEGLSLTDEKLIGERLLKKEGYEVKKKHDDEEVRYQTFGEGEEDKEKARMANKLKSRGFRGEVIGKLLF